jgi:hypothetical protein
MAPSLRLSEPPVVLSRGTTPMYDSTLCAFVKRFAASMTETKAAA